MRDFLDDLIEYLLSCPECIYDPEPWFNILLPAGGKKDFGECLKNPNSWRNP